MRAIGAWKVGSPSSLYATVVARLITLHVSHSHTSPTHTGDNYGCLLPEETGKILKFYCKLEDEHQQAAAAQQLETAAIASCVAATTDTPLLMPVRLARAQESQCANQYEVGFVSASSPPPSDKQREEGWPDHVYYANIAKTGKEPEYRAAVHADWYHRRAGDTNSLAFSPHSRNKYVLCSQILPVDLLRHGSVSKPDGTETPKLAVLEAVDTAVKRLSFLRFGVETQVY